MQWWPRRESGTGLTSTDVVRQRVRRPSASEHIRRDRQNGCEDRQEANADDEVFGEHLIGNEPVPDDAVTPVTIDRLVAALDHLDIRYLTDGDGTILAMWERHAVLIALEGPDDEILMMRARPHATVPPDWAERAYRAVNEWNHSRRFCKAYVGDPTDRGQLPIYAEVQVPLVSGVHEALLVELVDCGVSVSQGFVEWLHDDGCLL
jgi:hypothetical protein